MKKQILLIIVCCLIGQPSLYAQNIENVLTMNGRVSKITEQSIPLEKSLRLLEDKYNVTFIYKSELADDKTIPESFVKAKNFYTALTNIAQRLNLKYEKVGERSFLLSSKVAYRFKASIQEVVSGTVTDAKTGNTLPGVNILVKGTTTGASTDPDGNFELSVESLQDTLVVSYIGYQTKEIAIDGRTTINIELKAKIFTSKDELVVTGYGTTQKRQDITGAISSVGGEEIAKVPASNIGNALTGKLPGVQTIQTSGQPGNSSPSIFVRGITTLSKGGAHPLFVVDGVIRRNVRSVQQLDPENIESISVLKDASSTAVYGVGGANGVIVVETKQGQKGPLKVSAHTSVGFQKPTTYLATVGSYTYAKAYNNAQISEGINPDNVRYPPQALKAFRTGSNPVIYPDVDWVRYITNSKAYQSRTNINFSGGNDKVRFYVAGGYLKEDGFLKEFKVRAGENNFIRTKNPTFDRYNLRSNLNLNLSSSTKLSVKMAGRVGNRVRLRGLSNRWGNTYWADVYFALPFGQPKLSDTNGRVTNPGRYYIPGSSKKILNRYVARGYHRYIKSSLNGQISLTQQLDEITKGLQIKLKGAYNAYYTKHKYRGRRPALYDPYFRTDVDPSAYGDSTVVYRKKRDSNPLGYSESYGKNRNWYVEGRLQYNRDFGPHSFKGLLLYGQRKSYYPRQFTGIPRRLITSVGRINYEYKERYLLELSAGYNGSQKFAKGRRFGLFPSISGGWIVTNEPFMPEIPFLTSLKLRASYGVVGSDVGVGRFLYIPTEYNLNAPGYNFGNNVTQNKSGASEGALTNPIVTWAEQREQNYGMDVKMFSNRLNMEFEYFHKVRDGILSKYNTVPSFVSVGLPAVNLGKVQNTGYEARIKWNQQVGDFFYSVGGYVSYAKNKILYNDEQPRSEPYQRRTGESVGQPFGHVFDGFYTKKEITKLGEGVPQPTWQVRPGYLKYKDLNGDGIINDSDTKPIGYPSTPEYTFGSTMEVRYKSIDLSLSWAAATHVSQVLRKNPYRQTFNAGTMAKWQYEGRWTPQKAKNNPKDILYPRLSTTAKQARANHDSDFWLLDASYIRLKSVEIGYNLSQDLLTKLGLNKMRIYANAYYSITFSNMMSTYSIDPEQTGNRGNAQYPIMKVFNFGVKLNF